MVILCEATPHAYPSLPSLAYNECLLANWKSINVAAYCRHIRQCQLLSMSMLMSEMSHKKKQRRESKRILLFLCCSSASATPCPPFYPSIWVENAVQCLFKCVSKARTSFACPSSRSRVNFWGIIMRIWFVTNIRYIILISLSLYLCFCLFLRWTNSTRPTIWRLLWKSPPTGKAQITICWKASI